VATIKDVARVAGVGLGTASRVLSGRGSVSPATMEKVKKAIEELDFRPSHLARSLLSGNSLMVGVYIPVLTGTFYTPILQSIDSALRAAGVHMVVAFGNGNGDAREQELEGINFLIQRGADGLIVMSNSLTTQDLTHLGEMQSKVVLLNHYVPKIKNQCFVVDHHHGGELAARAFLDYGHRDIAVLSGPSTSQDNVDRIQGFFDELKRAGISKRKVLMVESDYSSEGGWFGAEKLMQKGLSFTGLFCANDEMAVGALSYFKQQGILVPEQLSVVGYDNTTTAEYSAPRLTSVQIPWGEITKNATNALLNRVYNSQLPVSKKFTLDVHFRASLIRHTA